MSNPNYHYSQKRNLKDWVPILSLLLAILSIVSGVIIAKMNIKASKEAKEFELTYSEKRKLFTNQLRILNDFNKMDLSINSKEYGFSRHDAFLSYYDKIEKGLKGYKSDSLEKKVEEFINNLDRFISLKDELILNSIELYPFINNDKKKIYNYNTRLTNSFLPYFDAKHVFLEMEMPKMIVDIAKDDTTYKSSSIDLYIGNISKVYKDYNTYLTDTLYTVLFPIE